VFENRVQRKTSGAEWEEVREGGRRWFRDEFRDFSSSPNICQVMKSRGMKWAGYVTLIGNTEVHTEFW
jgi:hypothetical protein